VLTPDDLALAREGHLAVFVTLMADGAPQSTPVWIDADDEHLLVNTAEGRTKTRNVRRDPRVAVSIVDRKDDYRVLNVSGRVIEFRSEGALEHIDTLARRYRGEDYPWHDAGETRVILVIEADRLIDRG
jgi:PPOX class probable F420-dependent enzyme